VVVILNQVGSTSTFLCLLSTTTPGLYVLVLWLMFFRVMVCSCFPILCFFKKVHVYNLLAQYGRGWFVFASERATYSSVVNKTRVLNKYASLNSNGRLYLHVRASLSC